MVVLLNLQQGIFTLNIHFIMYQVVNDSILLIFGNKALARTVLYHRRIGPVRIVHGAGNPEQRITQGRVKNPIFHSLPKGCPFIDKRDQQRLKRLWMERDSYLLIWFDNPVAVPLVDAPQPYPFVSALYAVFWIVPVNNKKYLILMS